MEKSRREISCSLDEKVAFLADARHYRGRPRSVETIETHFAWVFMAGERPEPEAGRVGGIAVPTLLVTVMLTIGSAATMHAS